MSTQVAGDTECQEILDLIPQKPPFRFIDKIVELSEEHIVAQYRFREDEYFYQGHFPGNPVTPGVILLEAMAQAGLVALGIYLLKKERGSANMTTLFTDSQVEFSHVVPPGALVTVRAKKLFWRRNKLRSQVELVLEDGKVAASGTISGLGVLL